jgi:hypothetical protein
VFAGAAREAVFSRPDVVRRVATDFVAVALKAGLVNNPPPGEEGQLYREIGRSKIAPQGICIVNSAGKVLDWVLMFDNEKSVLTFLDHARKQFEKNPDARRPVTAERYMKFPSDKLEDIEDSGKAFMVPARHEKATACPARPMMQRGTVAVRVYGRALGKDGKPVADTIRQEHYVEDRFHVSVQQQRVLAEAMAKAGSRRFRIADNLGRLLVSHAYLGQLDVNPVAVPGGKGRLEQCEFWGQRIPTAARDLHLIRIEGKSAAIGTSGGDEGDGRLWDHEVKLSWEGLIELKAERMTRLLLLANGSEKLRWGNERGVFKGASDVARLPAGHAIDQMGKVRYGFLGEPVPDEEAADTPANRPQLPIGDITEQARRDLVHAFGPTFLVFRANVQKELGLADSQKQRVNERLAETLGHAMQFFKDLDEGTPGEREKKLGPYRQRVQEKLAKFLRGNLDAKQLRRLRQIELQQHGLFALGQPEVQKELKLADEQRRQFLLIVQAMEQQIHPLVEEAQSGGKPEMIFPRIMKVRKEHEARIEVILTPAQKKQWTKMVGKPFDPGK